MMQEKEIQRVEKDFEYALENLRKVYLRMGNAGKGGRYAPHIVQERPRPLGSSPHFCRPLEEVAKIRGLGYLKEVRVYPDDEWVFLFFYDTLLDWKRDKGLREYWLSPTFLEIFLGAFQEFDNTGGDAQEYELPLYHWLERRRYFLHCIRKLGEKEADLFFCVMKKGNSSGLEMGLSNGGKILFEVLTGGVSKARGDFTMEDFLVSV